MTVYVYDKELGIMVDKVTREPMVTGEWKPVTPMTFGDLPEYQSPIDGRVISGRRARKYDLEKNNCIDANELPRKTSGKLKNPAFAKKHGLEHLLER